MSSLFCGIDFHKNTSTLCIIDQKGQQKELSTKRTNHVIKHLSNYSELSIAVEASGGVNDFVERLKAAGHKVTIVNPAVFRLVGLGGKKTDQRDAKALAEGLRVGFVPKVHHKSKRSREIKSLLVSREQMVSGRVGLCNHIRGILREYGVTLNQGKDSFLKEVTEAINKVENGYIRATLFELFEMAKQMIEKEKSIEKRLEEFCKGDEDIKRLKTIPGIGPLTALAFIAIVDEASRFPNSKEFGSYLGLVPSEHSSADKKIMGRITRSGPELLRRYLVHGARSVLLSSSKEKQLKDPNKIWAQKVRQRAGQNKATVALAHRMARIGFCLLRDKTCYGEIPQVVFATKSFNQAA